MIGYENTKRDMAAAFEEFKTNIRIYDRFKVEILLDLVDIS